MTHRSTWVSSSSPLERKVLVKEMAQVPEVYVLGGYQTDFARNWSKEKKHFVAMMREAVLGALEETQIEPGEIEVAHTGNFAGELYSKQGTSGVLLGDRSGIQRPSDLASRSCMRVGQHRPPRGLGRDRSPALRPRLRGRRRADEDRRPRRRRRLPRHGRLVRARGQGHRVPVPQALREARRRVRQALRAQGRAPRGDQHDQLREREAQPQRADPNLVHELRPRDEPGRVQRQHRRPYSHLGLLSGDRWRGSDARGLARVRQEVGRPGGRPARVDPPHQGLGSQHGPHPFRG